MFEIKNGETQDFVLSIELYSSFCYNRIDKEVTLDEAIF